MLGLATREAAFRNGLSRIEVFDVLSFLVPLLMFAELRLVGRLFASDILLAAALPFLVAIRGRKLLSALPAIFLFLCMIWFVGQVSTDFVRGTPFSDFARGWAKIVFTVINFAAIYLLLVERKRRIWLYVLGLILGGLGEYFFNPGPFAADHPWKFGYGTSITWMFILVAVLVRRLRNVGYLLSLGAVILASLINFYMGYRSLGGILFLVSVLLILRVLLRKWGVTHLVAKRSYITIGMVAFLLAGWATIELYETAARSGWIGEEARSKYEAQKGEEGLGILIGGRSEALASVPAVLDSPFLGHGSWAKNCLYASLLVEMRRELGYAPGLENEDCLIPSHSHILGAWVEAGLLGVFVWGWLLFLSFIVLIRALQRSDEFPLLVAFVALVLIWDILFSPYGATRRFVTPFYIVVLMFYLNGLLDSKKNVVTEP